MDGFPDSQGAPFLGVENSVTGKCWRLRPGDERLALSLAQRLDLPEIVGRLLAQRGVTEEEAEDFLDPRLSRLLPDPAHLRDMEAVWARITEAVQDRHSGAVFGDYDVDRAAHLALPFRHLTPLRLDSRAYAPDRTTE